MVVVQLLEFYAGIIHIFCLHLVVMMGHVIVCVLNRPFDEATGLGCILLGPAEGTAADQHPPFVLHLLYRPGHYDILYSTA